MKKILYLITIILAFLGFQSAFAETKEFPMNEDAIIKKNKQKFAALKKYHLPVGKYAIGGSGALGIRGIREINDIDILISNDLRDILIEKYGVVDDGKVKKIVFAKDSENDVEIEAFWEDSFYTLKKDPNAPTVSEIISHADIIDGLPFQSLEDTIYFKQKMNRAKDLEDIKLIKKWKSTHP